MNIKKNFKQLIYILIILNLVVGCQSLKDGLEGNKKSKNAEEFLIEKKNPLVLPPDYSKLPTPKNSLEEINTEEFNLEKILKKDTNIVKKKTKSGSATSLEKSILEKIKTTDAN